MSSAALAAKLASSLDAGLPCFVLVDPMLGEPVPVDYPTEAVDEATLVAAREQAWMRPVYVISLAKSIALPPHLHPYLVALEGAGDSWLADTSAMAFDELAQAQSDGLAGQGASAHRIGGWLQSSQSPDELTKALSLMLQVNTDATTTARYQRIADRRALDLLRHVVGDARVAAQLGRLQSWRYLDPCGRLALLQSSSELATALRLDRAEWASFVKGDLLHQTVARWLGESPSQGDAGAKACYVQAAAALEQAAGAARRWPGRFVTPADRVAWAVLMLLHPNLGQSPNLAAVLDAPPKPDEPIETLAALSPALHAKLVKAKS